MIKFVMCACISIVSVLVAQPALGAEFNRGSQSARALVTQRIDDRSLVTLPGNSASLLALGVDQGTVKEDFQLNHMLLQLKRSPEQDKALTAVMEQQSLKGSKNYHRWLTESEFDEAYGVNREDVQKVVGWLASHGFTINGVTPDGLLIDFSGNAAMVTGAFHTELHNLKLRNGQQHFANISDPRIPIALAKVIAGPVALHDFKPHLGVHTKSSVSINNAGKIHIANPPTKDDYTFAGCGGDCYAFTPGDAQTIYNITPVLNKGITGKGQTIGLIEDSNDYTNADWTTFTSTFGLASYGGTLATDHPSGSMTCADPGDTENGTDVEVELDVEYATATAPGANVVIESCADSSTTFGGLLAVENLASASTITTPILSISYDFCEVLNGAASNAAFSSAYQHAASRGISVFVASGDDSSTLCDGNEGDAYAEYGINVSGFASTPYNIAVGGTDFGDTYAGTTSTYWSSANSKSFSSALSYIPEIPWNNSCASQLIADVEGYSTTYGLEGFCNSEVGQEEFLTLASGSGGSSNCYSGSPTIAGVGASGTCQGQPKPAWQSIYGNPADGVRDIPDIALFAANGVWSHYLIICMSNINAGGAPCTANPAEWTGVGGTSAATPMMAGIQALINQSTGQMQGNPAPVYYSLASQEYGASGSAACNSTLGNGVSGSCTFYDITQGDMNAPCAYYAGPAYSYNCYLGDAGSGNYLGVGSISGTSYSPTFASNKGWDFATGIGSVNVANLISNWDLASITTATSLVASPIAVPEGTSVTLTASVTAASGTSASGNVTFQYGSEKIGACKLTNGTCSYSASTEGISPGTYGVRALYQSSNIYLASSSPQVSVLVGLPSSSETVTTLTVNPNPVFRAANVALTANVATSGSIPTGQVTFRYNSTALGSCTLSGGACTYSQSTSDFQPGNYNITANFAGNGAFLPSASTLTSVVVQVVDTATSLTANPDPVIAGTNVVLAATVSSLDFASQGLPAGTVKFVYGTQTLGNCQLVSGSCAYTASSSGIPPGTYSIEAQYIGSGAFVPSMSGNISIKIEAADTVQKIPISALDR